MIDQDPLVHQPVFYCEFCHSEHNGDCLDDSAGEVVTPLNIVDMTSATSDHRFRLEDRQNPDTSFPAYCSCGSLIHIVSLDVIICADSEVFLGRRTESVVAALESAVAPE